MSARRRPDAITSGAEVPGRLIRMPAESTLAPVVRIGTPAPHDRPAVPSPPVVDVWVRPAAWRPTAADDAWSLLSPDERARADRYRRAGDRTRFVDARAWVRSVLAAYVDRPAGALRFDVTCRWCGRPHGRPVVIGCPDVSFSVSRCAATAVVAIAAHPEVGIDLERPDAPSAAALARERGWDPGEAARFLGHWTMAEAILKATGHGLVIEPDTIVVSSGPQPRVVRAPDEVGADGWLLARPDLGDPWITALAVRPADP